MHPLVLKSYLAANRLCKIKVETKIQEPESISLPCHWLDRICGRHLERLVGLNSAYVKKLFFSSNKNYFRNIVGMHGIGIELLYLGMKI